MEASAFSVKVSLGLSDFASIKLNPKNISQRIIREDNEKGVITFF
jgi:hypothetical protein